MLTTFPYGWSQPKCDAFNALLEAVDAYNSFDSTLNKLGVNNPVLNQDRTDIGNMIKNQLGPALIAQG